MARSTDAPDAIEGASVDEGVRRFPQDSDLDAHNHVLISDAGAAQDRQVLPIKNVRGFSVYIENYAEIALPPFTPQIARIRFGPQDLRYDKLPFIVRVGESINIETCDADTLFFRLEPGVAPGTVAEFLVVKTGQGRVAR